MRSPDRGLLRVARAAAIAFCVVGISLIAHMLGGGSAPDAATLTVSTLAVAGYAGVLTRTPLGMTELLAALGAGQLLLHTVFAMATGGHTGGYVMVLAHIVATLVIAGVLVRGERAAWALWCWLRPRLRLPFAEQPPVAVGYLCHGDAADAPTPFESLGSSISWRGPPGR